MRYNMKNKIKNELILLALERDVKDISITYLCERADVSRSFFYSQYKDINDCIKKICEEIDMETMAQAHTKDDYTWLFNYVKENSNVFRAYFKICSFYATGDYKTTFFVNGLRAIITTWLNNNCAEPACKMNEIVMREYKKLFS